MKTIISNHAFVSKSLVNEKHFRILNLFFHPQGVKALTSQDINDVFDNIMSRQNNTQNLSELCMISCLERKKSAKVSNKGRVAEYYGIFMPNFEYYKDIYSTIYQIHKDLAESDILKLQSLLKENSIKGIYLI